MNNLSEIKEDIINFWEINENEKEDLLDKIRKYAAQKNENEFSAEVRATFEQKRYSGISVIYEALTADPEKWGLFIKQEYERAFKTLETSNNAFEVIDTLEEMCFVDLNKFQYSNEIIRLLSGYLSSEKDVLRYKAVWYMGDWIIKKNTHKYGDVINKIIDKLNDKNWKIRYISKLILEDMDQLPSDYKMSFMDKVRNYFFSPFNIK
jgi:exonuclease III